MKYTIKKTVDLGFDPTELDIIVGDKFDKEVGEDKVAYIRVKAILTHKSANSITQRATDLEYPFATWQSIVSGFDVEKKEPILNTTALKAILKGFNLELA